MNAVRLDKFRRDPQLSGRNRFIVTLWFLLNALCMKGYLLPFSSMKRLLLRLFGARLGKGSIIKPGVNIKYPWKLEIGDHVWIGEGVWIDNLDHVIVGSHVCISQGAMLLTGNHNYKRITFDLMTGPIKLQDGVWIGARAVVCPGVEAHSHAVLTAGSVATQNLNPHSIYQGNPAILVKNRSLE